VRAQVELCAAVFLGDVHERDQDIEGVDRKVAVFGAGEEVLAVGMPELLAGCWVGVQQPVEEQQALLALEDLCEHGVEPRVHLHELCVAVEPVQNVVSPLGTLHALRKPVLHADVEAPLMLRREVQALGKDCVR